MSWLSTAPLAVVGLVMFALLFVGLEVGYRMPGWLRRLRRRATEASSGSPELLVSAVLGLLALLLGFTFSRALSRFEARRDLVLQETNAIGTTWLRSQILVEPLKSQVGDALTRYAEARLDWSNAESGKADLKPTLAGQQALWTLTGEAVRGDPSAQLSRALMDAMNESFDLAAARLASRSTTIPGRVFDMLLLYSALSMATLGYVLASGGRRHRMVTTLVMVLLTLSLTIILDIDRPLNGAIKVSQQPLEALVTSMRSQAAAVLPPGR